LLIRSFNDAALKLLLNFTNENRKAFMAVVGKFVDEALCLKHQIINITVSFENGFNRRQQLNQVSGPLWKVEFPIKEYPFKKIFDYSISRNRAIKTHKAILSTNPYPQFTVAASEPSTFGWQTATLTSIAESVGDTQVVFRMRAAATQRYHMVDNNLSLSNAPAAQIANAAIALDNSAPINGFHPDTVSLRSLAIGSFPIMSRHNLPLLRLAVFNDYHRSITQSARWEGSAVHSGKPRKVVVKAVRVNVSKLKAEMQPDVNQTIRLADVICFNQSGAFARQLTLHAAPAPRHLPGEVCVSRLNSVVKVNERILALGELCISSVLYPCPNLALVKQFSLLLAFCYTHVVIPFLMSGGDKRGARGVEFERPAAPSLFLQFKAADSLGLWLPFDDCNFLPVAPNRARDIFALRLLAIIAGGCLLHTYLSGFYRQRTVTLREPVAFRKQFFTFTQVTWAASNADVVFGVEATARQRHNMVKRQLALPDASITHITNLTVAHDDRPATDRLDLTAVSLRPLAVDRLPIVPRSSHDSPVELGRPRIKARAGLNKRLRVCLRIQRTSCRVLSALRCTAQRLDRTLSTIIIDRARFEPLGKMCRV
jgi:hypothetical protein